jgi:hypothetical protein
VAVARWPSAQQIHRPRNLTTAMLLLSDPFPAAPQVLTVNVLDPTGR